MFPCTVFTINDALTFPLHRRNAYVKSAQVSISPGGGVLFPLRLKTKDERREDSAPPTLRRRLGKIHPPHPHRPETGVGDISAQRHTVTTIFTLHFFAFFARFLTLYLYVFATVHCRTKYALFRTVRSFPHPLATKARRRQRQNPLRNCALIRAFSRCSFIFAPVHHQSVIQTAPKPDQNLCVLSRVSVISASVRHQNAPQTVPRTPSPPKRTVDRAKTRSEAPR